MAEGFNPKEEAKEIAKKALKRRLLTLVVAALPSLLFGIFIIIIVYVILNPFQFLFGMTGQGSADSSDSTQTQAQKDITAAATNRVKALEDAGATVDKYLALSSGFYGISYNMNDTTNYDENADPSETYKSEIINFINIVTNPGDGLTQYDMYCKDKDNKVKCGTKESNTCSTTCKSGSEPKLVARTQEDYQKWLVSSGTLETHLKKVGYEFSTDDTEKTSQLNAAAQGIVDNENLYKESFSSSLGSYGTNGSLEDGKDEFLDCSNSAWDVIYQNNPFVYRGQGAQRCVVSGDPDHATNNQCTTFAWYMFNKYYVVEKKFGDYDYQNVIPRHGNGYQWAYQICKNNPGKFNISETPAPGAIISCYGYSYYNPYGHVAFVVKVEGDAFWVSEGNYTVGGYEGGLSLNHKYNSVAAYTYGGSRHVIFAVPCAGQSDCGNCTEYTSGLND